MRARRSRVLAAVAVVAAALGAGACSTAGAYDPTPLYTPSASPSPSATSSPSPSATPSPSPSATASPAPSGTDVTTANCLTSYAPPATLPSPGRMPSGSYMRKIQDRGKLIAGVSADTLLLGARNPFSNQIEGFDIDMLHAVSQAIFGRPDKIEYRVITALEREPVLQKNRVDIVARAMTINCARWKNIAFSSEYYRSSQQVLIRDGERSVTGAPITGIEGLAGKKVCAPKGTSSLTRVQSVRGVEAVAADTHTGCLVLFQQGLVDAITGDATVLAGLAAQDPYAQVVKGPALIPEPYGLGVNKENVDFVRFLNGVLEQMRADGRLTQSYDRWLAKALGKAPAPPEPVYGRVP